MEIKRYRTALVRVVDTETLEDGLVVSATIDLMTGEYRRLVMPGVPEDIWALTIESVVDEAVGACITEAIVGKTHIGSIHWLSECYYASKSSK